MVTVCKQIRANGERCSSPALRGKALCYWHFNSSRRHSRPAPPPAEEATLTPLDDTREAQLVKQYFTPKPHPTLNLPPLEDRESIQLAISVLCAALARNEIEPKRASLLLYGLQVASSNVRGIDLEPRPSQAVRDIATTIEGQELAA